MDTDRDFEMFEQEKRLQDINTNDEDYYKHVDNETEMREHQDKIDNRVYVSESYWY